MEQEDRIRKVIEYLENYEIEIAPFKAGHRFYLNPQHCQKITLGYLINSRPGSMAYNGYLANAIDFLRDCKKHGAVFKRKT